MYLEEAVLRQLLFLWEGLSVFDMMIEGRKTYVP